MCLYALYLLMVHCFIIQKKAIENKGLNSWLTFFYFYLHLLFLSLLSIFLSLLILKNIFIYYIFMYNYLYIPNHNKTKTPCYYKSVMFFFYALNKLKSRWGKCKTKVNIES